MLISKIVLSGALLLSQFVPHGPPSVATPPSCVRAMKSLNLYFGSQPGTYSTSEILDSLKFCRINDWSRQAKLYVSESRNLFQKSFNVFKAMIPSKVH